MQDPMITCPHCKGAFPLTETIALPMLEAERAAVRQAQSKAQAALAAREDQIKAAETNLRDQAARVEAEVARRAQMEVARVRDEEQKKARGDVATEVAALHQQVASSKAALVEAQKLELAARIQKADLEQKQAEFDLTVQRAVDAQRQQIRDDERLAADEAQKLKLAEKDRTIADMVKQLEAAKRASEKTSQELQGDVQEADLAAMLGNAFPSDEIQRTQKGQNGADIVQVVIGARRECGKILWESKRTKHWSDGWLPKLRDDQRAEGAEVAVLVSSALPGGVSHCELRDGIWIVSPSFAPHLATALRQSIIEVAQARITVTGQHEKSARLYAYVTGAEFAQRMRGIVEAFVEMQQDLESEKRTATQRWAKREKQIKRMLENTLGLYGEVEGISGAALPELEGIQQPNVLSLPEGGLDPSAAAGSSECGA